MQSWNSNKICLTIIDLVLPLPDFDLTIALVHANTLMYYLTSKQGTFLYCGQPNMSIVGWFYSIHWNLPIMDTFELFKLSLIQRCPLFGGQIVLRAKYSFLRGVLYSEYPLFMVAKRAIHYQFRNLQIRSFSKAIFSKLEWKL